MPKVRHTTVANSGSGDPDQVRLNPTIRSQSPPDGPGRGTKLGLDGRSAQAELHDPLPEPPPDLGEELRVVGDTAAQLHRQRCPARGRRDVEDDAGRAGSLREEALERLHRPDDPVGAGRAGERDVEDRPGDASTGGVGARAATATRSRASSGSAGSRSSSGVRRSSAAGST